MNFSRSVSQINPKESVGDIENVEPTDLPKLAVINDVKTFSEFWRIVVASSLILTISNIISGLVVNSIKSTC